MFYLSALNLKNKPAEGWLRYPDGTDYHPVSALPWREDKYYSNPSTEVWYYRTWLDENIWKHSHNYYWWSDPRSWYVWSYSDVKDERGWFEPRITIPTPDELDSMIRITEWIESKHPVVYLETWT